MTPVIVEPQLPPSPPVLLLLLLLAMKYISYSTTLNGVLCYANRRRRVLLYFRLLASTGVCVSLLNSSRVVMAN